MPTVADVIAEIIARHARDEPVDQECYLRRYPEYAEPLRRFLNAFDLIGEIVDSAHQMASLQSTAKSLTDLPPRDPYTQTGPGGFAVIRELRRGAQGVVYEAVQRSTGRRVALKLLHAGTPVRSSDEAAVIARLRHPNLVTVYEAGEFEKRAYYAMELVDGVPLDAFVTRNQPSERARLRLFQRICAGVSHAHRRGIIHRDLKPSNILVDRDGQPRVLDFGLAKYAIPTLLARDSEDSTCVGTLAYSPPEQIGGRDAEVDARSDVYSLGVILHEMLTLRLPYIVPDDPAEAVRIITERAPHHRRATLRHLDRDLGRIFVKATAPDPTERYQSVAAMAREVRQYLAEKPLTQNRHRPLYVARKFLSRHRLAMSATAAALVIVALLGVRLSWLYADRQSTSAIAYKRFELLRHRDLQLLNDYQSHVASTNRLYEIKRLQADEVAAYLVRYKTPPLDPEAEMAPVFRRIPTAALSGIRRDPDVIDAVRKELLTEVSVLLDDIARKLETHHFRFLLKPDGVNAIGWERHPSSHAVDLCGLFVSRAYLRHEQRDVSGAAADIRAAILLASDIGDGVLHAHRSQAYLCHRHILGFLHDSFVSSIRTSNIPAQYARLIREYPELPLVSPVLRSASVGLSEMLDAAVVTRAGSMNEQMDLVRLDRFLEGFFAEKGSLTNRNIERVRRATSAEVLALVERYVISAEHWDALTASEIERESAILEQEIVTRRSVNPILWLVSLPDTNFLDRLEVCSRRQALRLVAQLAEYRVERGTWPQRLVDVVPLGSAELIDPRTGQEFEFEIVNEVPHLCSIRTATSQDTERDRTGDADCGSGRVSYFPM